MKQLQENGFIKRIGADKSKKLILRGSINFIKSITPIKQIQRPFHGIDGD